MIFEYLGIWDLSLIAVYWCFYHCLSIDFIIYFLDLLTKSHLHMYDVCIFNHVLNVLSIH